MRTSPFKSFAAVVVCFVFGTLGCSPRGADDVGRVGLALQVAPGVSLGAVSYSITGPGGFARAGAFDTSHSTTLTATIGGLPAGDGFSVALSATASDGATQCAGAAPFSVVARATTGVTVHLLCHEPSKTGSVLVNGSLNVCPVVDGVSATPDEVLVGSSIALAGAAHDADGAPAPLTFHWTASAGTLSDASAASPTFTCAASGSATITLAVSDGDCGDSQSVTVTCTGSAGAGTAGTSGAAGAGAAGASGAAGAGSAGTGGASGAGAAGTGGASGAGAAGTSGAAGVGAAGMSGVAGVGAAGAGGAAGTGAAGTGTAGAGDAPIVINEVESNGDPVGDWVELTNTGTASADISGWKLKDNDDTHAFVVVPAGTSLAAGGFFRIYVFQTFGLGAPDMARLFDPAGNLVDSYSWTTHATGTYGRCPDGTGPFVDSTPTPAAPNACGGTTGAAGSGAAGAGGSGGTGGLAGNEFPWPSTDPVITVDDSGEFASNLSGLSYQPATSTEPDVLWGIQNGPSKLYRLLLNPVTQTWESDTTNDWGAGKTIHYLNGTGDPDSEGVSKAELADSAIYVSTERDNDNNQVNRFSVLRYDTTAAGTDLTATNDWELTPDLPAMGINLGLEAITYIPDTALVAGGFFDEAANALYDPSRYPNHGTGLFFVGLESNGVIYAYALNHADNSFTRVATFPSGQVAIMDLSYDRDVGYLWAQCDNTCGDKATVFRIDTAPGSPTLGHFEIGRVFDRPDTLPDSNFEGIGIAPESECVGGLKHFFWSDDSALDMHSIRRGSIPCGAFF